MILSNRVGCLLTLFFFILLISLVTSIMYCRDFCWEICPRHGQKDYVQIWGKVLGCNIYYTSGNGVLCDKRQYKNISQFTGVDRLYFRYWFRKKYVIKFVRMTIQNTLIQGRIIGLWLCYYFFFLPDYSSISVPNHSNLSYFLWN